MTSESVTKVRMAELTGGEARELLAGQPVILLPMGSHEDQGPHAPMGDYLTADRMAEIIARRVTDRGVRCLVAPALPFGGVDYFGTAPGGIALTQPTLVAVLRDVLACLIRHGLTKLVVINGHGGNVAAIHQTTQEVYRKHRVLIPSFYLWQVGYRLLPSLIGEDKAKRAAGHGADPLTSVAWHLFPGLMRPDLVPQPATAPRVLDLPVSGFGTVGFEGVDVQVPVEVDEIAPNGVFRGDARLSSPETGKLLVEKLAAVGADFVAHYAAEVDKRK